MTLGSRLPAGLGLGLGSNEEGTRLWRTEHELVQYNVQWTYCSETTLIGESRFHISTPLGIWTWVPCDGKQTGSPLDQWDIVRMKWDCRLSTIRIYVGQLALRGELKVDKQEQVARQNKKLANIVWQTMLANRIICWQRTKETGKQDKVRKKHEADKQ
jgi:hypothetical protein